VHDHGLDDLIPNDDIIQAAASGSNHSPVNHATEALTDLVLLGREKRVADAVFGAGSYASGFKETLSGTDQWDDYDNSNPREQMLDVLDLPLMRPNVLVLGQAVWTKLRQHPKLVSSVLGNSGQQGTITRQQLAELLEIEEVLVGQGWVNLAKPGQDPQMVRVWGKHASLIHRNRLATTQRGVTFGFTAQYQGRISGQIPEPKVGLRGAVRVRVGESVRELIVANELGYFFENAIS
ncbi:MAG: phage capsid protein, partial [Pseudomonadota bacterium]|nr:phage capsid protein [Pseudomonadota bacterium]